MKKESKTDKMVAYMNAKYDDHFKYSAPFGGGVGATSTQIVVTSDKFPDAQIWVEYYTQDGKDAFADNYVDYKFEKQTKDALQGLLEKIFESDVKLNFNVGTKGVRNSFTDKTTFDEYKSNPDSRIGFRAFVSNETMQTNKDIVEDKVKIAIADTKIVVFGSIYIANDSAQFDEAFELPSKTLDMLTRIQFDMDNLNSFTRFEWRVAQ